MATPHRRPKRRGLCGSLKLFRETGRQADPVVFGSHRKPEGVILSYERYEWLTEVLDELVSSEEVREALRGTRVNGSSFTTLPAKRVSTLRSSACRWLGSRSSSSTPPPRIGFKVPYGDEEHIYRQVGRALDRLLGSE